MSEPTEVNLNLRLTGREVYRAVRNFIATELKLDPAELKAAALAEARKVAAEAVREHLRETFKTERDVEWYVLRIMQDFSREDVDRRLREDVTSAVKIIVSKYTDQIEKAAREQLESGAVDLIKLAIEKVANEKKGKY